MEPNATLRLNRFKLSNFRCFTDCSLELNPNLTVLVAENAQGKTAILNAISIALDVFVAAIARRKHCHEFEPSDIHRIKNVGVKDMVPAPAVRFDADGLVDGASITWSRTLNSRSAFARNSTK